jgi:acyl-CoA hydrolase
MTDQPIISKTVAESAVSLGQFMNPEHANSMGNVHGGHILKLCDECGGIVAFHEPVRVSQLLMLQGRITYVGRTSMEVEVRVEAENLLTGERTHTNSAYFIYVALDENGQPTEVPRLDLVNDEERRRYEEGRQRQEHRLRRAGRG